jgi:cytoplasmic iron level regulating protein YaaA (DUF328/UPF0246 family)
MLFLLSPAKTLDYQTPLGPLADLEHSSVVFGAQTRALIEVLRGYSPAQIAELMDLSDALAALNVARYQAWSPRYTVRNARQAVLAFNGDVYEGLDAWSLTPAQLGWAQAHVRILSGLYGVLRPLDRMQPYRLEMGTRLPTAQGRNLVPVLGTSDLAVAESPARSRPHAGGDQPRLTGVLQVGGSQGAACPGDRMRL